VAAGTDDLPSVRAEIVTLERERGHLERTMREVASRPVIDRDGLVTELIDSLANVREIFDAGEPDDRKAVVRSFLARDPSRPRRRPGGAALVSAAADCMGQVSGGGRN
jgi:hypothetical protein